MASLLSLLNEIMPKPEPLVGPRPHLQLKCPFPLRQPDLYRNQKVACNMRISRDISDWRDHLKWAHRDDYNCTSCKQRHQRRGETLKKFVEKHADCKMAPLQGFRPEVMTKEQSDADRGLSLRGTNHLRIEQKIGMVLEALFPGETLPLHQLWAGGAQAPPPEYRNRPLSPDVNRGGPEPALNECDKESDIESDIYSLFSETESRSSSISSLGPSGIQRYGAREVARALLGHDALMSLCSIAISKVEAKKCRTHFKGFLRNFAQYLKSNAGEHLEVMAANFIGSMAGAISDEIRQEIVSPTGPDRPEEDQSRGRFEEHLLGLQARRNEDAYVSTTEDDDEDLDDRSETEHDRKFTVSEELKEFILSAEPLEHLVDDMKSWLGIHDRPLDAESGIQEALRTQPRQESPSAEEDRFSMSTESQQQALRDWSFIPHIAGPSHDREASSSLFTSDHGEDSVEEPQDGIEPVAAPEGDTISTSGSRQGVSGQRQAEVASFLAMFTRDKDVALLYKLACRKMDQESFTTSHCKMLLSFVSDLSSQKILFPSEYLTLHFLRQPHSRAQISVAIYHGLKPTGNIDQGGSDDFPGQLEDLSLPINNYLLEKQKDESDVYPETSEEDIPKLQHGTGIDSADENLAAGEGLEAEDKHGGILPSLKPMPMEQLLCTGRAFNQYKHNLQHFYETHLESTDPKLPNNLLDLPETPMESEGSAFEYGISFSISLRDFLLDSCKRAVEKMAGTQLSWWPLSEPERMPNHGYTRVYSTISSKQKRPFYDDIPTPMANSIFPRLVDARTRASEPRWSVLGREAVHFKDTTLSYHLHRRADQCGQQAEQASFSEEDRQGLEGGAARNRAPCSTVEIRAGQPRDQSKDEAILFLTCDASRDVSVAVPVNLGQDDKTTMENLHAAFRSLSPWRWKLPIGIRFYRFQSFHFQPATKRRYIVSHTDRERYPEAHHDEYANYVYSPSPWVDGCPCPCPGGEAWFFFNYPDQCGTSRHLNDALPVRRTDTQDSRITAWGVHIEQRYSVLVLAIPVFVGCFVTIAGTIWFAPRWLEDHPDDLQGATVPAILALAVVHLLVETSVVFLIFRWNL